MLRAALLPGDAGKEAAKDWLASADFQRLGKASRGILPILYERLRQEDLNAPLMPVLKGVKRHTWYNNRRLFHHGGEAVRLLKHAGIDVMLLKGAAMVVAYYHDDSIRPMEDLDILVRYHHRISAVRLLMEHGWEVDYPPHYTENKIREGLYKITKSIDLVNKKGIHLDLHWNLTHYCLGDVTDNDFWEASDECKFEGQLVKVLNPADQLLHILVHGAPWSTISPIRWIPDAVTVLNLHPDLDWDRLISQAKQRSLAFMVRNALRHLDGYFHGLVPARVLSSLGRIAPMVVERIEYWNFTRPGSKGLFRNILSILSDYLRYSKDRSLCDKLRLMPGYLKTRSGAKGLCQFVYLALLKIGRDLSRGTF